MSEYMNSIPDRMCRQWKMQCLTALPNNFEGQDKCNNVQCGFKIAVEHDASWNVTSSTMAISTTYLVSSVDATQTVPLIFTSPPRGSKATTTTVSSTDVSANTMPRKDQGLSTGMKIGLSITLIVMLGVILALSLLMWQWRKKHRKSRMEKGSKLPAHLESTGGSESFNSDISAFFPQTRITQRFNNRDGAFAREDM